MQLGKLAGVLSEGSVPGLQLTKWEAAAVHWAADERRGNAEELASDEGSRPIFYYSDNTALICDNNKPLKKLYIKSL